METLFDAGILDFIYEQLTSTFMGEWLIFIMLLAVTTTVLIKTKSFEVAGIVNLILFFAFVSFIPMEAFITGIVISVLAIAYPLWSIIAK